MAISFWIPLSVIGISLLIACLVITHSAIGFWGLKRVRSLHSALPSSSASSSQGIPEKRQSKTKRLSLLIGRAIGLANDPGSQLSSRHKRNESVHHHRSKNHGEPTRIIILPGSLICTFYLLSLACALIHSLQFKKISSYPYSPMLWRFILSPYLYYGLANLNVYTLWFIRLLISFDSSIFKVMSKTKWAVSFLIFCVSLFFLLNLITNSFILVPHKKMFHLTLLSLFFAHDCLIKITMWRLFNQKLLGIADKTRRIAVSRTDKCAGRLLSENSYGFIHVAAKFNVIGFVTVFVSICQMGWTFISFFVYNGKYGSIIMSLDCVINLIAVYFTWEFSGPPYRYICSRIHEWNFEYLVHRIGLIKPMEVDKIPAQTKKKIGKLLDINDFSKGSTLHDFVVAIHDKHVEEKRRESVLMVDQSPNVLSVGRRRGIRSSTENIVETPGSTTTNTDETGTGTGATNTGGTAVSNDRKWTETGDTDETTTGGIDTNSETDGHLDQSGHDRHDRHAGTGGDTSTGNEDDDGDDDDDDPDSDRVDGKENDRQGPLSRSTEMVPIQSAGRKTHHLGDRDEETDEKGGMAVPQLLTTVTPLFSDPKGFQMNENDENPENIPDMGSLDPRVTVSVPSMPSVPIPTVSPRMNVNENHPVIEVTNGSPFDERAVSSETINGVAINYILSDVDYHQNLQKFEAIRKKTRESEINSIVPSEFSRQKSVPSVGASTTWRKRPSNVVTSEIRRANTTGSVLEKRHAVTQEVTEIAEHIHGLFIGNLTVEFDHDEDPVFFDGPLANLMTMRSVHITQCEFGEVVREAIFPQKTK